jgi:MFS family permease
LRIGLWYTANGAGIALGGLLGYAIGHIRGALASWRYEFIIIGILCCVWGIVIAIFMPDSPVTAKFLNQREKRIAVERLKGNQTGIENKHLKVTSFSTPLPERHIISTPIRILEKPLSQLTHKFSLKTL